MKVRRSSILVLDSKDTSHKNINLKRKVITKYFDIPILAMASNRYLNFGIRSIPCHFEINHAYSNHM